MNPSVVIRNQLAQLQELSGTNSRFFVNMCIDTVIKFLLNPSEENKPTYLSLAPHQFRNTQVELDFFEEVLAKGHQMSKDDSGIILLNFKIHYREAYAALLNRKTEVVASRLQLEESILSDRVVNNSLELPTSNKLVQYTKNHTGKIKLITDVATMAILTTAFVLFMPILTLVFTAKLLINTIAKQCWNEKSI